MQPFQGWELAGIRTQGGALRADPGLLGGTPLGFENTGLQFQRLRHDDEEPRRD